MTREAIERLRALVVEADASAAADDLAAVLKLVPSMRGEVVSVSSRHGEFRQLFDLGLLDLEGWAEAGDLAAAATSVDTLRLVLSSLEQELAHV